MIILPAIDVYEGKAVRLYKGDYDQMTVYDDHPVDTARKFRDQGAEWIHMVDLEGARDGGTPNMDTVSEIVSDTGLKIEIGGGVRSMDVIERYLSKGVSRVILGTAAACGDGFVGRAVEGFGDRIAVGADIRDGHVAVKGWLEKTSYTLDEFCEAMQSEGVRVMICTDISRDGAMRGTNRQLYRDLSTKYDMDIIASGGVSSMDDILSLKESGVYGAIIGKAYYTGVLDIGEAVKEAR